MEEAIGLMATEENICALYDDYRYSSMYISHTELPVYTRYLLCIYCVYLHHLIN